MRDPESFARFGGLVDEASPASSPCAGALRTDGPLLPEIRIGDLGVQSGLAGVEVAARSALQERVAAQATLDGSDCSTNGRASGHLSLEVER